MGVSISEEPLAATIRLHYAASAKLANLTCCAVGKEHRGATLLVVVDGRWNGIASCDELGHLTLCIGRALADAAWR